MLVDIFLYISGSLFMLIYVDFEILLELILEAFGSPKRAWE